MPNSKISSLSSASTPLAGTEVLPIVQSGNTVKVSVSNLTNGRPVLASAVGINVSPATLIHAQGSDPNLGTLELDSNPAVEYVGLTLWTKKTSPNANARNWQIAANYQSFGTFDILSSTTATGNPTTARFSMDNAGNATLNTGNLVIGTSGKGINFTANTAAAGMTSQLLNWYEEGTLTATATPDTGSITLSTNTLRYTRIGRAVHISGILTVGSVSSPTGNVFFTLPFSAGFACGGGIAIDGTNAFTGDVGWFINSGQSNFYVYYRDTNGAYATSASIFKANTNIRVDITYTV